VNKSLKALTLGYVAFKVNGKWYWTYNAACAARKAVPDDKSVVFVGRNIITGWHCFYLRTVAYSREELKESDLHDWTADAEE